MNWLAIVLTGHLLNALAFLMDKFLLTKKVPSPFVYAFFIGGLGILALVLIPFGFTIPPALEIARALLAGATFILALIFFFAGLKENEASRVVPLTGGLVPLFTFILAYFLVGERLGQVEIIAFALLLAGSVLISLERGTPPPLPRRGLGGGSGVPLLSKPARRMAGEGVGGGSGLGYVYAVAAGLVFAISFVITKQVFLEQNFVSGFVWSRIGGFIAAVLILLIPSARRGIFNQPKQKNPPSAKASPFVKTSGDRLGGLWQRLGSTTILFLTGQAAGALGFVLVNYAISLASVTLVNAMQGAQYAFLLVIVLLLSRKFPQILSEKLSGPALAQKIIAILLISAGIGLIAF